MKPIAQRCSRITPSQTVAIDTRYKLLKSAGMDVISLAAGEPDFDTPDYAKQAAIHSIEKGLTKYSAVTGLPELKASICSKFRRENGLDYSPNQIVVSGGAKHCIFNILLALIEKGDEVIIPSPYWVTYPELVKLVGGKPVLVSTSMQSGFKITAEQLSQTITPDSKLVILNSPANPTGAVYSRQELEAIGNVILENDLYCLSDEIYEHILYDGHTHTSIASLGRGLYERTLVVNGMSKAHAMTGWRIGYVASFPHLAEAIGTIQSHSTHHPANASQYAALAALEAGGTFTTYMLGHFRVRKAFVLDRLAKIPFLIPFAPQGAFYVFLSIEGYLGKNFGKTKIASSLDLCEYLLNDYLLAVVPGTSFGLEGYIRLSFASSIDNLTEALKRLENGLSQLK